MNTLYRGFWACLAGLLLLGSWTNSVRAVDNQSMGDPNVLVIFSSINKEYDDHQRMLDMLLGHFTSNIKFVSSSNIQKRDLEEIDYLFYYGKEREVLSEKLIKCISEYEKEVIAIGNNIEQLTNDYDFLTWAPVEVVVDKAEFIDEPKKEITFKPRYMLSVEVKKEKQAEVIMVGKMDDNDYPLYIKKGRHYYFASDFLKHEFAIVFAEALRDIFQQHRGEYHPGYIRLEDIHPFVDPNELMSIAQVLAERDIPYMMAVIPIYTNPQTEKQYKFSDSPQLLKTLKFMQDHGGSIVLHGYTHQFRLSETGEGFEFWDVEHNRPIYHGPEDEVLLLTEQDFNNRNEYKAYLKEQQAFERNYTEERLIAGIYELANYGLYPLAFEAPHYTMSQHGYEIVSDFCSTYVGQMQLSDDDWEIMTTSPLITKPTFLHGMNLLPETIGYIDPSEPNAIERMLEKADDYQFVGEGMISGFYHPYLGVDKFIELLDNLEEIPNIAWIDLKQMNNRVKTDLVFIQSKNGDISVTMSQLKLSLSSWSYFYYHLKNVFSKILWCMAGVGILAILNFIYHIIRNRNRHHRIIRGNSIG